MSSTKRTRNARSCDRCRCSKLRCIWPEGASTLQPSSRERDPAERCQRCATSSQSCFISPLRAGVGVDVNAQNDATARQSRRAVSRGWEENQSTDAPYQMSNTVGQACHPLQLLSEVTTAGEPPVATSAQAAVPTPLRPSSKELRASVPRQEQRVTRDTHSTSLCVEQALPHHGNTPGTLVEMTQPLQLLSTLCESKTTIKAALSEVINLSSVACAPALLPFNCLLA